MPPRKGSEMPGQGGLDLGLPVGPVRPSSLQQEVELTEKTQRIGAEGDVRYYAHQNSAEAMYPPDPPETARGDLGSMRPLTSDERLQAQARRNAAGRLKANQALEEAARQRVAKASGGDAVA